MYISEIGDKSRVTVICNVCYLVVEQAKSKGYEKIGRSRTKHWNLQL